jgi:hypothetical protein
MWRSNPPLSLCVDEARELFFGELVLAFGRNPLESGRIKSDVDLGC